MPLDEFWHGDLRLLEVYQKAYLRDKSYTAWLIGAKVFEADSKVSYNANRTKKSDKVEQYDDWKDPIPSKRKNTFTRDNAEQEFRDSQVRQNAWLHNMMHKQ